MPTKRDTITAVRVDAATQYDRETTTFTCPMTVADETGATSTVHIPYLLNVDHERRTYEYISNADGSPMSQEQAEALALVVAAAITKNVDVISVTQTSADVAPQVTITTVPLRCGSVQAGRVGTGSVWTVTVQEDTPTYSVAALTGNPIEE